MSRDLPTPTITATEAELEAEAARLRDLFAGDQDGEQDDLSH